METTYTAGSHLGYPIFLDETGYYINGLNGLGQEKKIYFPKLSELKAWIDSEFKNRYKI